MPVEILTASQRAEWERFPEEIDEASLSAFFSFADDELELIAGHRDIHGRFAIAEAELDLAVTLEPQPGEAELAALLAKAERDCFVGASLTVKPAYRWSMS